MGMGLDDPGDVNRKVRGGCDRKGRTKTGVVTCALSVLFEYGLCGVGMGLELIVGIEGERFDIKVGLSQGCLMLP